MADEIKNHLHALIVRDIYILMYDTSPLQELRQFCNYISMYCDPSKDEIFQADSGIIKHEGSCNIDTKSSSYFISPSSCFNALWQVFLISDISAG